MSKNINRISELSNIQKYSKYFSIIALIFATLIYFMGIDQDSNVAKLKILKDTQARIEKDFTNMFQQMGENGEFNWDFISGMLETASKQLTLLTPPKDQAFDVTTANLIQNILDEIETLKTTLRNISKGNIEVKLSPDNLVLLHQYSEYLMNSFEGLSVGFDTQTDYYIQEQSSFNSAAALAGILSAISAMTFLITSGIIIIIEPQSEKVPIKLKIGENDGELVESLEAPQTLEELEALDSSAADDRILEQKEP